MRTTVSIIVATFNRAHLISVALKSIQKQSFVDFECLIIDDGSTDNTAGVVKSYLNDDRFKYYKRPAGYGKGLPGCRNFGLDHARGDYISFCDDDDSMHPQNLDVCVKLFKDKNIDFVHFQKMAFVHELPQIKTDYSGALDKSCIGPEHFYNIVSNGIPLASCTVMWKKNSLSYHRFNEQLQYAEEWEFYTRLISCNLKGVGISNILYYNRKHHNSNTGEFWSGNPTRMTSKVKASKLVIDNLIGKRLFDRKFQRFFVQSAIFLKSRELLEYILKKPELTRSDRIKFANLYRFYPLISFLMRRKKQFKKISLLRLILIA